MYTSNRFPSMANMMHRLLFIITSESYLLSSSSTLYCLLGNIKTKEKGECLRHKPRYTKTITQLRDQMILIKHGVTVCHSISPPIRADRIRNTQFIHGTKMLERLHVFGDYLQLASG